MEPWSARTVSHFLACASGYYRKHIMATKPSYRWFNPLLAAILSLLAMRGGFAAPPDFAQVPAEIDWFVHVDIDALHNSTALPQIFKKASRDGSRSLSASTTSSSNMAWTWPKICTA